MLGSAMPDCAVRKWEQEKPDALPRLCSEPRNGRGTDLFLICSRRRRDTQSNYGWARFGPVASCGSVRVVGFSYSRSVRIPMSARPVFLSIARSDIQEAICFTFSINRCCAFAVDPTSDVSHGTIAGITFFTWALNAMPVATRAAIHSRVCGKEVYHGEVN